MSFEDLLRSRSADEYADFVLPSIGERDRVVDCPAVSAGLYFFTTPFATPVRNDTPMPLPRPRHRTPFVIPANAFRERPWLKRARRLGSVLLLTGAAVCVAHMPANHSQELISDTQALYLLGAVVCIAAAAVTLSME